MRYSVPEATNNHMLYIGSDLSVSSSNLLPPFPSTSFSIISISLRPQVKHTMALAILTIV